MTIASEIEDLQTNLASAKAAVTTKGGTVGDTGLAGLATEIASIPSGGGGEDWGSVTYRVDDGQGGYTERTATIRDQAEFMSLAASSGSVASFHATISGVKVLSLDILSVSLGDSAKVVPSYFLTNCSNLLSFSSSSVVEIGNNFLSGCPQFNSQLDLSKLTKMGNYFLNNCTSFNQPITIPSGLTSIPQRFINGCTSFNQNLVIPSTVTTVNAYFLYNCNSMTSTVTCNAPASVIGASNNNLSTTSSSAACYVNGIGIDGTYASEWRAKFADRTSSPYRKLNYKPVVPVDSLVKTDGTVIDLSTNDVSSLCNSGQSTASITVAGVSVVKQDVYGVDISGLNVTTLNDNFCRNMTSLEVLRLPTTITTIGWGFMAWCTSFNQPIDLTGVTSIDADFLWGCSSFNSSITMPSTLTSISADFLSGCSSFNQPLNIPSTVTTIGNAFLSGCSSFNQSITIPNGVTEIGNSFMKNCIAFDQDIAFPSSITLVKGDMMYNCSNMTSTITCGAPSSIFTLYGCDNSFSTDQSATDPTYVTGITIVGTYASDWKSYFPDRSSSPYRKLIVAS